MAPSGDYARDPHDPFFRPPHAYLNRGSQQSVFGTWRRMPKVSCFVANLNVEAGQHPL